MAYAIFIGFALLALLIFGLFTYFSNRDAERHKQQMEQELQQREREQQEWRKEHGFER
jgi:hypothetical protein